MQCVVGSYRCLCISEPDWELTAHKELDIFVWSFYLRGEIIYSYVPSKL